MRNQLRIEKIYGCEGMNEETSVDDQSISSADAGEACSSQETIFPFFTLKTTSAIFAMFWLCVTITIVFP